MPSLSPYTYPSQDTSNIPSSLVSTINSVDNSNHPRYIPLYAPGGDLSISTSVVPSRLPQQNYNS